MKTLTQSARIEDIERALHESGKVMVAGFGTFYVGDIAATKWTNPVTGKEMDVPERKTLRFRPHKQLKARLESKR